MAVESTDLNINWLDNKKKKLKIIASKYKLYQRITSPTRTTQTKTLIDLSFTNKPERVTKMHNLLTGLSDHNMTFIDGKLTKHDFTAI